MVFWSCTLYELNPEVRLDILDGIWRDAPFEYIHDTNDGYDLRVFFENQNTTPNGPFSEVWLDILSPPYYARGRLPQRVPLSVSLGLQFLRGGEWPNLVGIFGQRSNADKFRWALREVYGQIAELEGLSKIHVLNQVVFRLRENEECLNSKFPDMKELSVEGLSDFNIDKAVLKGHSLNQHPLFDEWVRDELRGGQVRHFGFFVRGETVIVSTIGNMYSRQGRERFPHATMSIVLRNLLECRAVRFQSTMDKYLPTE